MVISVYILSVRLFLLLTLTDPCPEELSLSARTGSNLIVNIKNLLSPSLCVWTANRGLLWKVIGVSLKLTTHCSSARLL